MVCEAAKCSDKSQGRVIELPKGAQTLVIQSIRPSPTKDIHCLPSEIVGEIFCRVCFARNVIRCKRVCKHWFDLISHPGLIRRFDKTIASRSVAFRMSPHNCAREEEEVFHTDFLFNLEDRSLSVVSLDANIHLNANAHDHYYMVGACGDFFLWHRITWLEVEAVLFGDKLPTSQDFYIRNILTQQQIQVPSYSLYYRTHCVLYGFYSDLVGGAHRYSIFVIQPRDGNDVEFKGHQYISSKNQWSEKILELPIPCRLCPYTPGFTFGGKICFVSNKGLISFDPFDDNSRVECHFVAWPHHFYYSCVRTAQWQGCLLSSLLDLKEMITLEVWCLEDFWGAGECWTMLYKVGMPDSVIRRGRKGLSGPAKVLSFDPEDPKIVYLINNTHIMLWDSSKKMLVQVSHIPKPTACFAGCWPFDVALPGLNSSSPYITTAHPL